MRTLPLIIIAAALTACTSTAPPVAQRATTRPSPVAVASAGALPSTAPSPRRAARSRSLPSPSRRRPRRTLRRAQIAPQGGSVAFSTTELRIRSCESGPNGYATHGWAFDYDYKNENPTSTASGAWQIVNGTWDGYGGYHHASYAPPRVQDRRARQILDASGTVPWNASRSCWG